MGQPAIPSASSRSGLHRPHAQENGQLSGLDQEDRAAFRWKGSMQPNHWIMDDDTSQYQSYVTYIINYILHVYIYIYLHIYIYIYIHTYIYIYIYVHMIIWLMVTSHITYIIINHQPNRTSGTLTNLKLHEPWKELCSPTSPGKLTSQILSSVSHHIIQWTPKNLIDIIKILPFLP